MMLFFGTKFVTLKRTCKGVAEVQINRSLWRSMGTSLCAVNLVE